MQALSAFSGIRLISPCLKAGALRRFLVSAATAVFSAIVTGDAIATAVGAIFKGKA